MNHQQVKSIPLLMLLMLKILLISTDALSHPKFPTVNRRNFVKNSVFFSTILSSWCVTTTTTTIQPNNNHNYASAIEFIPASPNFKYSYQDGLEILATQRVACDNILAVISDGNLNEAAFKIMQLNAQVLVGGKIVLDSIQNDHSGEPKRINGRTNDTTDAVNTLKLLKCQEKFATLIDVSNESEILVSKALKGKLGATTPAQLKLLSKMKDVRDAFDDFILEFIEDSANTSL